MSDSTQKNRLYLKVTPGARRNEITGYSDGILQVKVTAPPVQGIANRELIEFLSRSLGVNKSSVAVVRGQTSRNKVVTIEGLTVEDILNRLSTDKKEGA